MKLKKVIVPFLALSICATLMNGCAAGNTGSRATAATENTMEKLSISTTEATTEAVTTEVSESIAEETIATEPESTVPTEKETYTMEDYTEWLVVLDNEKESLMPFVDEALRQKISPSELFYYYLRWAFDREVIGDSAAYSDFEYETKENSLLIRGAILDEFPMNTLVNSNTLPVHGAPLTECVAGQYQLWEQTGNLGNPGLGVIDADTPPYYQVTGLAIDGTGCTAKLQLTVDGVDFGVCEINDNVLLLPIDAEAIIASQPVTVELTLIEGTLPDASKVFVALDTNITGGR
ncbi:MAG: hypothetical protein PT958_05520 [Firmicutes bacterium]|nr:hypothetical protein [Bacillota bacterium]